MTTETLEPETDSTPDTRLIAQLAELGADVEKLRDTDEWMRWLTLMSKLHRYSFGNQILIGFQCPTATYVAGFNRWKQLNRQVRKGEKGIKILAPHFGRKDDDGLRKIIGFGTAHVFDVAQTDGDELPAAPDWPMATGTPLMTFAWLADTVAHRLGYGVSSPPAGVGTRAARGWVDRRGKHIWVRELMLNGDRLVSVPLPTQMGVLLHELGHGCDPGIDDDLDVSSKELVAESVAWVVGTSIGLDMDDQVKHYLASWGGTAERLVWVGRRIAAAVKAIEAAMHNEEESA